VATYGSSYTLSPNSCRSGPGFIARAPASLYGPNPEGRSQRRLRQFQLSTTNLKTSIAILVLRVREVWQAPCLYPYVMERTHAEDLDH
jgi:hypothetical protein